MSDDSGTLLSIDSTATTTYFRNRLSSLGIRCRLVCRICSYTIGKEERTRTTRSTQSRKQTSRTQHRNKAFVQQKQELYVTYVRDFATRDLSVVTRVA